MKVALAFYPGDMDIAAKLSSWIVDLGPNPGHTALLAVDDRCHPNMVSQIRANFEKAFDSVEILSIPDRIDGWPEAPNRVFARVAKQIQYASPSPWLWLEADVVPLKGGWVQALEDEYNQEPKKPFLGDFVSVPNVPAHMSGIGVYPPNLVDHAGPAVMAFETAWDVFAAPQIVPKMKQTQKIQHKWKHPAFENMSQVDNLLGQLKDTCVLFHADKSGTLIDFLREKRKPLPQPTQEIKTIPSPIPVPANGFVVDILIKTYPKDYGWLHYCLRSIQHFVTGFRSVITISPERVYTPDTVWPKQLIAPEYGNDGYLSQQVFKLNADTFTDADYVLLIDSDTIFTRPVTPQTYFKNGKVIWMITPIEQAHPDQQHSWRRVMEKFMGKPTSFEFMRRFPFVLPRWVFPAFREFCEKQHGMTIDKYIMSQPYREFSEFNCLGFYLYEYHRDKFEWVNTSLIPESEWPVLTVDQQWSHNPIPKDKWETILSAVPVLADATADVVSIGDKGEVRESTTHQRETEQSQGLVVGTEDSRGGRQTILGGGHGDCEESVPELARLSTDKLPKPAPQTKLEKLRANAAKARAALAAKRAAKLSYKNKDGHTYPKGMGTEITRLLKNDTEACPTCGRKW